MTRRFTSPLSLRDLVARGPSPIKPPQNRDLYDLVTRANELDSRIADLVNWTRECKLVLESVWRLVSEQTVTVSTDYTILSDFAVQRFICTNASLITLYLPVDPKDGQEVEPKRTDAQVTMDGNGFTIDGETTLILSSVYDAPHLIYTADAGEWSIL